MSETIQLDQLLTEKSSVEDEGHELDEEQRQLKIRAKVLTEKIIQELRKRNNTKQENVNQLQGTVNDLESQLNALTVSTISGETHETTETIEEPTETAETYPEEPAAETTDDTVSVTEVAEEIDMDSRDKKKRKFF